MEAVSYTAQWTAAARCLETERDSGGLFKDPTRLCWWPAGWILAATDFLGLSASPSMSLTTVRCSPKNTPG
jgi:hypothetical protein